MKRTIAQQTESALKRFLKKKVAFTASLLVAFLITGGIGLASSEELAAQAAATQETLIANIEAQKAEIQGMLDSNNERLKQLKLDTDELIRKGQWYSKPTYKNGFPGGIFPAAQQVFFTMWWNEDGKSKNNTKDQWGNTLDAIAYKSAGYENPKGINPYAKGEQENGILKSLEEISDPNYVDNEINGNIPQGLSRNDAAAAAGKDPMDILQSNNGAYVHQTPWVEEIDLGANILPLSPVLPAIGTTVSVDVASPELTAITIPNITIPAAPSSPTVTSPTLTAPAPVAALNITAPTAPSPQVPTEKTISISQPSLPGGYEPTTIKIPRDPSAPTAPTITVLTPPAITFNGTGFGQPYTPYLDPTGTPTINNYDIIDNTVGGKLFIESGTVAVPVTSYTGGNVDLSYTQIADGSFVNPSGGAGSYWNGGWDTSVTQTATLTPPGAVVLPNVAFINDAADHDVTIKGDYEFKVGQAITNTSMFMSLNPYEVGKHVTVDRTYDFAGNLTLKSELVPGDTGAVVGFEHQELANGPGGGQMFYGVTTGQSTSILKNSGTIDLNSGSNLLAFMIDTEAAGSHYLSQHFLKQPQTINDGLIKISSGATNSIAFDYGNYCMADHDPIVGSSATTTRTLGPNNNLQLGNIEIDGNSNFGLRMKDYSSTTAAAYGGIGINYYDTTTVTGANGTIKVNGTKNIGIGVYQGATTDVITDTWNNPGTGVSETLTISNGHTDPGDIFSHLNIAVGGIGNVGFYRNYNNNPGKMHITSNTIDSLVFDSAGTQGTLMRTDLGELVLDTSLDITAGGVQNSAMQSAGTGGVSVGATGKIKASIDEFYALTAGDFASSTGATAANEGKIELTGNKDIGLAIATGNDGENSGTITVKGTNSTGIFNKGTTDITAGTITAESAGSTGIYNDAGTTNISGTVALVANNGATALSSKAGTVTSTSGNTLSINVDGQTAGEGVGVFGLDGANIDIRGAQVKVVNGSAGIAVKDAGTIVNLQGGVLDFEGQGFAAYSDGNTNTIDLTNNGEMKLRGRSVGFSLDISSGTPVTNVLFDGTSKITMLSNDAVAMDLKLNTATTYDLGNKTQTGSLIKLVYDGVGGVPVTAGTELGITYNQYRLAATEEGKIKVDSVLDKSTPVTVADGAYDPSVFFFRSFLAQKSKIYVDADINANLTSALATDAYKGYVTGLEMNSSTTAAGVADSLLQVENNSTVTADRTDAGAGAIGVYANYTTVNVDAGSKINVETGANTINDNGIGIYGVDGSVMTNAGDVTVAGNKAIGILGLAYRTDSTGTPIIKEYGGLTGEGITTATNNGNITVKGNESVGMYMVNNSAAAPDPDHTQLTMTNAGNIEVGTDAGAQKAVGMYGDGDVIMQFTAGNITVGENGIGMYGAKGANISAVAGAFTLGKDGIGVISDGTAAITATGTATFTGAYITGESGKIGVAYVGPTAGTIEATPQTIGLNIDVSGLDHGSALYVRDKGALTTTGNLTVGNEGVGVYLANGDVTNTGTITLTAAGNKAVGMYTTNGTVVNSGTITENNSTQFGMVGNGAGAIVDNAVGTVNLATGTGNTGILVANQAQLTDSGNINFGTATESFGVVATNANVNLGGTHTYTLNNSGKNIYVYGEKGSMITLSGTTTVNGGGVSGNDKSVGVYLDGTNGANTFTAATGTLNVQGGMIGVYSKGTNTLNAGTFNVTGDGTVGIYFENAGTLSGVTTINVDSGAPSPANAVGVYGAAGNITVDSQLVLNLGPSSATGMYLDNGSAAVGAGTIDVTNTSGTPMSALYYTGTTPATHGVNINLNGTNAVVGIFADGGSDVTNTADIKDYTGMSVGAVVGATGGIPAQFTNAKNISQETAGSNYTGMYVLNGTGKNANTITVIDGIGAVVDGTASNFDGTVGTINVTGTGTGIALTGTGPGQVLDAGTISLASGSLGVYAENNAFVDFPVILTGTGATGVYAKGGSTVSGSIDASNSLSTIGLYTEDPTVVMNSATIKTGDSSVGWYLGGTSQTYSTSGNTIESAKPNSVGVYVSNGNTYNFGDTINVGSGSVGIMTNGAGTTLETNNGTMNIDGGVGIVAGTGSVANVGVSGPVNVTFSNGGILSYADGGQINLGSSITTSGAGTLAATKDGSLTNSGTFTVSDKSIGLLGIYDTGSGTILNDSTGVITVNNGGIGLAAKADSPTATGNPTVQNDNTITVNGENAVGMYANIGTINNTGVVTANAEAIGIYATNTDGPGATVGSLGTINVTGGTGYVFEGISGSPAPTSTSITLNAGDATNRSVGGFYKDVNGNIDQPSNITVAGDYTVAMSIDGGTNTVTGNISDNGSYKNNIGLSVANGATTGVGTVTVTGPESNIGVYGNSSTLTTGSVSVGNSTHSADKAISSIGVYMEAGTVTSTDVTVGDDSLGVFGKNSNVTINGNIATGKNAVGVYVDGDGTNNAVVTGNISVDEGTLGVYTKNASANVTGNMDVAPNLGIGIVNQGTGDINYNGTATVADKGATSASIAIYKGAGQGTVNTAGSFDIGKGGYAIYADNLTGATGPLNVNNSANITLAESAVGIYAGGPVNSNNTGNIVVGSTYIDPADTTHEDISKFLNSIGMYGEEGAQLVNSGTIDVSGSATNDTDHSVGVYVKNNGTTFTNAPGGNILVDRGGVGVLAIQNAKIINDGTITVDQTVTPVCGGKSIGVGLYSGSTLDNNNTINVNGGYGVYLADATTFTNYGTMNITNGAGVSGGGTYVNKGTLNITGGSEYAVAAGDEDPIKTGAITIGKDGSVIIGNQYIGAGTLMTLQPIVLDNALVDITTGKTAFIGDTVNGTIKLTSDFISTGNGYSWTAEDFVQAMTNLGMTGNIAVSASPLYVAHMAGSDLMVAKQPYAYLVTGSQFDNLYNGIDSLLALDQEGTSKDSVVLKGLNTYLDNLYNTQGQQAFDSETGRTLAEMRGDIYSTTYKRMENIQHTFDDSYNELLNASNATKDSGKFSVIYQQGKYEDDTIGIDDYDYRVQGLMYMREIESRNYGSKFGYGVGFAVSRFDFDDAPTFGDKSKEDVYSLRAGLSNVHSFGEDSANDRLRLISRLELGYNRHEAVRSIELDKLYKNKGHYNSMNVTLDNKLEGTLYRDLKSEVKLYGAINLEYGYMGKFTERAKGDSALVLTVKDQDYFSVEPEVGIQGIRKAYIGKKVNAKIAGKLAYGYELGNLGDDNRKAKVNGGTEGYYELIKPDEERGHVKGNVGLTIEKPNGFGITAEVEVRKHDNKKDADVRYGGRLNYTF